MATGQAKQEKLLPLYPPLDFHTVIHHIPDTWSSNVISKNGSIFLKRQMSSSSFLKNTTPNCKLQLNFMHKSTFFNSDLNSVEMEKKINSVEIAY